VITVFPDENLEAALGKLGTKDVAHLPVVDRQNPRKVVGMLSRREIVNEHNKTLLRYA
jgi:CIC family chloride channel protein